MPPAMLGIGLAVGLVLWVLARQYDGQESVESQARNDPRYKGVDVATALRKIALRAKRKLYRYGKGSEAK